MIHISDVYSQIIVPTMPRGRIELPTPASSEAELDYLITRLQFCGAKLRRGWALVRDYCWGSPASLYTCLR